MRRKRAELEAMLAQALVNNDTFVTGMHRLLAALVIKHGPLTVPGWLFDQLEEGVQVLVHSTPDGSVTVGLKDAG